MNLHPAKGRHFILQALALHANPYDGHTLKAALDDVRDMVGRNPLRAAVVAFQAHKISKENKPEFPIWTTTSRILTFLSEITLQGRFLTSLLNRF